MFLYFVVLFLIYDVNVVGEILESAFKLQLRKAFPNTFRDMELKKYWAKYFFRKRNLFEDRGTSGL